MSTNQQHTSANSSPGRARVTVEGRQVVILEAPKPGGELDRLTKAEEAVVVLAAKGATNAEIAEKRGRSQRTIANQLRSAYKKLGLHSRTQLVRRFSTYSPP